MYSIKTAALALGLAAAANAQTYSLCNPIKGDECDPNPAFGGKAALNLGSQSSIKDLESFFIVDGGIKYDEKYDQLTFDSAEHMRMSINEERHAPLLISHDYLFFGRVDVELRAAPGAGIITSIVLQSDTLDEVDWEFVGNDQAHVQTNLFYQGVEDYTHGAFHELAFNPMDEFHTYSIDWTPEKITFLIDGNVVREHLPDSGVFPQTPCQLRIGTWVGGKGDSQGTIDWAGGRADFSKGPFDAYYKSISIVDYAGGYEGAKQYEYTNEDGTWDSIKVTGGKQVGFPNSDFPPVNNHEMNTASVSGTPSPSLVSSASSAISSAASSIESLISSASESASSAIESSSVESSSVETTATTGTTSAPTASPTSDGQEEEEDDNADSAASSLQKGGLVAVLAVAASALLL